MKVSELVPYVHLPDLIARECGADAIRGLHSERGGVICDPRPGHEERNPSFSVYQINGNWRWKRFSGDGASGNAYDFLLACGYSKQQAWEELHRLAGIPLDGWRDPRPLPQIIRPPPSALQSVRAKLAHIAPLDTDKLAKAARLLLPLTVQDAAAQDLQARGLWNFGGLGAWKLRYPFQPQGGRILGQLGALAFYLMGPDGQSYGLKLRNTGSKSDLAAAKLDRYVYRLAGHGAPAWCSPEYGEGQALLVVEGELNGAAASRALRAAGMSLDVQGLAGAGGVPYLEGMADRTVYLYFDADKAGQAGRDRVALIAQEAGAAEVRLLAPLPTGDFCEELGRLGAAVFGVQLQERLNGGELWQAANGGKCEVPQIKAAPSAAKTDLWQWDITAQDWTAQDNGWAINKSGW